MTVTLTVLPELTSTLTETIRTGESITVNGVVYDENNLIGVEVLTSTEINGCDSTVTVDLGFAPDLTSTRSDVLCFGESIEVNGITYDADNLTGVELFTNVGLHNVDSTVTINITVLDELTGVHEETVCFGESITVNGTVYDGNNLTGTEVFTGIGTNSCDSTVTINITVLDELTGVHEETVCFGESITVNGTVYDGNNSIGTEVFTGIGTNSCDSTVIVVLTVLPELMSTLTETIRTGESRIVNNVVYDENNLTGVEVLTSTEINECDSTVTVNLGFAPDLTSTRSDVLCFGESIVVNGIIYDVNNLTGVELFTNVGPHNVDSTVTINITVLPELIGSITDTVCAGGSITVNGRVYNTSVSGAIEVFTGIGINGCDSTVTINFTVLDPIRISIFSNYSVCNRLNLITFPTGNPAGGVYSGIGITDGYIDVAIVGDGVHEVEYSYTDEYECSNSATTLITVVDCGPPVLERGSIRVPEGFSPNGDGVNDLLNINNLDEYPLNTIIIFNRWGNKVFEGSPYTNDWDGTNQIGSGGDLPTGTYFYILDLGEDVDSEGRILKGHVYLTK